VFNPGLGEGKGNSGGLKVEKGMRIVGRQSGGVTFLGKK